MKNERGEFGRRKRRKSSKDKNLSLEEHTRKKDSFLGIVKIKTDKHCFRYPCSDRELDYKAKLR